MAETDINKASETVAGIPVNDERETGEQSTLYAEMERDAMIETIAELERERDALDRALRLALSRAQVDRMLELQRQGFTGTIYEAWDKGLMPDEYRPAWEMLKNENLRTTDSKTE